MQQNVLDLNCPLLPKTANLLKKFTSKQKMALLNVKKLRIPLKGYGALILCGFVGKISGVELIVFSLFRDKLIVSASLDYSALLKYHYAVGVAHR